MLINGLKLSKQIWYEIDFYIKFFKKNENISEEGYILFMEDEKLSQLKNPKDMESLASS